MSETTFRTVYDQVASLIVARHIQTSLGPSFGADTDYEVAGQLLWEWGTKHPIQNQICLVHDKQGTIGWCTIEMISQEHDRMGRVAEVIKPSQIVSGDTPFLKLPELFAARTEPFVFVLDGGEYTG